MACVYVRHVTLAQARDPVDAVRSIVTALLTFKLHIPIRVHGVAIQLRGSSTALGGTRRSQHAHLLRLAMSMAPTVDLVMRDVAVFDQVLAHVVDVC